MSFYNVGLHLTRSQKIVFCSKKIIPRAVNGMQIKQTKLRKHFLDFAKHIRAFSTT